MKRHGTCTGLRVTLPRLSVSALSVAMKKSPLVTHVGDDPLLQVGELTLAEGSSSSASIRAQAAAFHQQFVQLMNAGAGSYASTEAANVSPLRNIEAAISRDELTLQNRARLGPTRMGRSQTRSAAQETGMTSARQSPLRFE